MDSKPQQPQHSSDLPATNGGAVLNEPGSDYLITIQCDPEYEDKLDLDRLDRLAIGVLQAENVAGPLELGVAITSDQEVRALNKQYLSHDYNTDVIAFSMEDEMAVDTPAGGVPRFVPPPERPPYLGDIAISYERAAEQAPEYGQGTEAEVATLLIHGLLHLLGYDDLEDAAHERMHARQRELFERFWDPEE